MRHRFIRKLVTRIQQYTPSRTFSTERATTCSNPNISSSSRSRIDKWIERYPRFLQPTLFKLRDAPASHVTAFLILHELTALVPLLGLAGAFHYLHWLPTYFAEGKWAVEGIERFARYFKRKGWISESEGKEIGEYVKEVDTNGVENESIMDHWMNSGNTMRWTVELATAWAIVKVLLPVRIVFSVWWSPWFARWTVIPVRNTIKGLIGKAPR